MFYCMVPSGDWDEESSMTVECGLIGVPNITTNGNPFKKFMPFTFQMCTIGDI